MIGSGVRENLLNASAQLPVHTSDVLVEIFNRCFLTEESTRLMGGASEPVYHPSQPKAAAEIHFTRDYFASALHEIAHWCVAGRHRRTLEDYGYWYAPDGRSREQQAEFERVEVRPQALEWFFSEACGWRFRVSADNLDAGLGPSEAFKGAVHGEVSRLCSAPLSPRVSRFAEALLAYYRPGKNLTWLCRVERFDRESL